MTFITRKAGAVGIAGRLLALMATTSMFCVGTAEGAARAPQLISSTQGSILTVSTASSGEFTDNFNPFLPTTDVSIAQGIIYEPLFLFDAAKAGVVQPWLATHYSWSNGGKTITFQLRHGVDWSDGQPMTSADVAYTFELEMRNPALNVYGLPYKSVSTNGPYGVTVNFTKSVYDDLLYIAGQTYIVPEHIWKSVSNPAKYADTSPVGTGPYELTQFSPQSILVTANPHYYMKGLPRIHQLRFLAEISNAANQVAIRSGQVAWGAGYLSDVVKSYIDKSKNNVLVPVNTGEGILVTNDVSGPTASLAVRKAISEAINRQEISTSVYQGYYKPANEAALPQPLFNEYAAPVALHPAPYDPAKSKALLQSAGYKLSSNGLFVNKAGQPLVITVTVNAAFSDFISSLEIMTANLRQAGIELKVSTEAGTLVTSDLATGHFQIVYNPFTAVPNPYAYYYDILDSSLTAPVGGTASGDYGRYRSARMDSLLGQLAATSNTATQKQLLDKIQNLFVTQLPYIPVVSKDGYAEFQADKVTGYPTPQDPYASAMSWARPDAGWVAARLSLPKSHNGA